MLPRGLVGLGRDTMDQSGIEVAEVSDWIISRFLESPPYAVRSGKMNSTGGMLVPRIQADPRLVPNTHLHSPPCRSSDHKLISVGSNQALRVYIQPGSLPCLVHCTQGKDRTGLIVTLILLALGVPTDAVTHDYLLSQQGLLADRETRLAEIREIGLTPEWGDCPQDFVVSVKAHVDDKYGGIEGYLDSIGFGAEDREKLVEALGM